MLNILLDDLKNIIPIKAIVERNSTIELEYFSENTPSEEQLENINLIISEWPFKKAKLNKIKLLDDQWKYKVNLGWTSPYGYKLGIDISDVALLNGAFTLAKEASNMGINDPVTIVDIDGQSHAMSLQDLTLLMLQYGQGRSVLSNSYATIKQAINNSTSLQELDSININL
jgi:hypothetical protein